MKRRAAFTLPELLVVLAIVTVLLGASASVYHTTLLRLHARAASDDFESAASLARTVAMGRGSIVVLAAREGGDDGEGGEEGKPGGAAWQHGWTVFIDNDGDGRPGPGDEIIHQQAALNHGIHFRTRFTSGTGAQYIAYNAAGRPCRADNSQAARWGTLAIEAGGRQTNLIINMLGRMRVCDPKKDGASCTGPD